MKIALQIKGGKDLAAALRKMPEATSKRVVTGALMYAGMPMADAMAALMKRGADAPHAADNVVVSPLTWRITVDGVTRAIMPDEYAVGVGPAKDFYYWFFREYGTVHQPASPAMRPGFDQSVEQSLRIVVDTLRSAIEHHAAEVASK